MSNEKRSSESTRGVSGITFLDHFPDDCLQLLFKSTIASFSDFLDFALTSQSLLTVAKDASCRTEVINLIAAHEELVSFLK